MQNYPFTRGRNCQMRLLLCLSRFLERSISRVDGRFPANVGQSLPRVKRGPNETRTHSKSAWTRTFCLNCWSYAPVFEGINLNRWDWTVIHKNSQILW